MNWLRGLDLNQRPSGYEPVELPGCSTPRHPSKALPFRAAASFERRFCCAFGRPGSDLLSRVLRRSTIGAGAFHGRVRNGIGCSRSAMTTRSAKRTVCSCSRSFFLVLWCQVRPYPAKRAQPARPSGRRRLCDAFAERPLRRSDMARERRSTIRLRRMGIRNENDQADRAISTGKLHALPHFHTRPIDVVVFHGSDRDHSFSGGFPA